MQNGTRPVDTCGQSTRILTCYAVNAAGAYKRLCDALILAEGAWPEEPSAEWASAVGHMRCALGDMGRCMESTTP